MLATPGGVVISLPGNSLDVKKIFSSCSVKNGTEKTAGCVGIKLEEI